MNVLSLAATNESEKSMSYQVQPQYIPLNNYFKLSIRSSSAFIDTSKVLIKNSSKIKQKSRRQYWMSMDFQQCSESSVHFSWSKIVCLPFCNSIYSRVLWLKKGTCFPSLFRIITNQSSPSMQGVTANGLCSSQAVQHIFIEQTITCLRVNIY